MARAEPGNSVQRADLVEQGTYVPTHGVLLPGTKDCDETFRETPRGSPNVSPNAAACRIYRGRRISKSVPFVELTDRDRATMRFNNAISDGHAEPRAGRFRCEEGVEDVVRNLLRHPWPVVADMETQLVWTELVGNPYFDVITASVKRILK